MDTTDQTTAAMDEDKREEEAIRAKRNFVDLDKLKADITSHLSLVKQGLLHQALEGLLNLEKNSRLSEDITATKECCKAVLEACLAAKDWKLLEEHILLLAKRRGQLKQAVQAFVRQAILYIDQTPDKETKISLIKTLQAVTEGKIYVEIERARLTRKLAIIMEAEGKISEAAEILQEVAVETFGAMAKTEKIAFILEQVRLCLDRKDYVRAQILSRKISTKAFVQRKGEGKGEIGIEGTAIEAPDEGIPELPQLKIVYYHLMIRYHSYYNNYLEMCRCYKAIYDSEGVADDAAKWTPVLQKVCWAIILAPAYSTEEGSASDRLTLLTSTFQDKKVSELPTYKQLLNTFITKELVHWNTFQTTYGKEIAQQTELFAGETGTSRLEHLKLRVVEHNIFVVSGYYTRIKTSRLAALLDLTSDKAEDELSKLVVAKAVSAKIDRPAGVVVFRQKQRPDDVLNGWSDNINKLLDLVEKSCQQIQKECMVHKVPLSTMT